MSRKAQVVIGSNLGDEGKGLVTDFLTARSGPGTVVARFNGGAQAGHTVVTPDGKRHVFSHFGSGSFLETATYLSRFFVCNPIVFFREEAQLAAHGIKQIVYADTACPVTTPYDIMINQIAEDFRGKNRHGSVGVGFGETVDRHLGEFTTPVSMLNDADRLRQALNRIRAEWLPARLAKHGVTNFSDNWKNILGSEEIRERYIEDCCLFYSKIRLAEPDFLTKQDNIIFEGAQGLMLDQNRGRFPYVTRSNTGLKNVAVLAQEAGINEVDIYYVTRAYATRHGAGPLPHELSSAPYEGIHDPTNIHNSYQGSLRFGWLDIDQLGRSVRDDLSDAPNGLRVNPRLVITCMDQVDSDVTFISDRKKCAASREALVQNAMIKTGALDGKVSFGPTRLDLEDWKTEKAYSATAFCSVT